jgi:hypothetical protein
MINLIIYFLASGIYVSFFLYNNYNDLKQSKINKSIAGVKEDEWVKIIKIIPKKVFVIAGFLIGFFMFPFILIIQIKQLISK